MIDPQAVIRLLGLAPHPTEGGWYVETWRGSETLPPTALAECRQKARSVGTAIYYLLTADTVSALHRLSSDEIFHFYLGDPVEMIQLHPDKTSKRHILGTDLLARQRPQILVPAHSWQGARLVEGGRFALLGCTVAPGFEFTDYEHATDKDALIAFWPHETKLIEALFQPPAS